jgi:hypothetical protein
MSRSMLVLAVVLALTGPAFAVFPGTDVYLPSVGRGPGAEESNWYTTVWLHNPSSVPVDVQVFFHERSPSNPVPLVYSETIEAGATRRYPNAVEDLFGVEGFGALRVTSTERIIVNSRIYSQPAGGSEEDTVGQFFAGVPASFAIAQGQSTQLLGVFQTKPDEDSQYRYNFGFAETTGAAVDLRVRVLDQEGLELDARDYSLGGFGVAQYSFKNQFAALATENARITVEVVGGTGRIIAFGSGLANTSNDPSTFDMSYSEELLAEYAGTGTITGVTAGQGLAGGGTSGTVTLDVGAGQGIHVDEISVGIADGGISTTMLADAAVTLDKLSAPGGGDGQVLTIDGSELSWQDPPSGSGTGDITAVNAGAGLTGGGSTGDVSLAIATGGVTSAMIADDGIAAVDVAFAYAGSASEGGPASDLECTACVTAKEISSDGASVGQVLKLVGTEVTWEDDESGDLVLPFSGVTAVVGPALQITNDSGGGEAIRGTQTTTGNYAYLASNHHGVLGRTGSDSSLGYLGGQNGVYGRNNTGTTGDYAGYFSGPVHVNGTLSKSGGSFKIDHPLSPDAMYLSHSFVESPDMMNIYNGNVVTDSQGEAWVELPEWFEALNRDFRYQLTVIGAFAQAIVAEKISDNRFLIRSSKPETEVSWQVTGIRQDPWAEAHRIPVEEYKTEQELGFFLHPELYGKPAEAGIEWAYDPEGMQQLASEAKALGSGQ